MIFSERPKTIQTTIYAYDLTGDVAYHESQALAQGGRCATFNWISGDSKAAHASREHFKCLQSYSGQLITLELDHVFDNQWNSAECGRVFDWTRAVDYAFKGPRFIQGHYLIQTDEMREIRQRMHKCGYCGAMYWDPTIAYCTSCTGSEYLKLNDLHLLQLLPAASSFNGKRKLTDSDHAELIKLYRQDQVHATNERDRKRQIEKRARVLKHAETTIRNAEIERDGMILLLDNGINTSNVIYYNHTGLFSFGWQKPYDDQGAADTAAALEKIGFSFKYEIKKA